MSEFLQEAQSIQNKLLRQAYPLVEKWTERGYLDLNAPEFVDEWKAYVVAQLLENYDNQELTRRMQAGEIPYQQITENTTLSGGNLALVDRATFPLIRAVFANLIAMDLVSVQPMTHSVGNIYYLHYLYGNDKNTITKGTRMFRETVDPTYTQEGPISKTLGTGTAALLYDFVLDFTPISRGTVTIDDGTSSVVDDGSGGFTGTWADMDIPNSTINYTTGQIHLEFTVAPNGLTLSAVYNHNMETSDDLPSVDIRLTSSPISADPRKLRARWSMDAAMDLQNDHQINADMEIATVLAEEIKTEIDREILDAVFNGATTTVAGWDATPTAGTVFDDHVKSLKYHLNRVSNEIYRKTRRWRANWLVASIEAFDVISYLPQFNSVGAFSGSGAQFVGTMDGLRVYTDPDMTAGSFMMGYKGQGFMESGYVYAPYQALYTTGTHQLDDFLLRRAVGSRYATKMVNPDLYATSEVLNYDDIYAS